MGWNVENGGITMERFPSVSMIINGDRTIGEIETILTSIRYIKYPLDQLEFFLILPYYRPVSSFVQNYPKLRQIRFDGSLTWSLYAAQREGLSLAKGHYVQIINFFEWLHPKWLRKAVTELEKSNAIGVISRNDDPPPSKSHRSPFLPFANENNSLFLRSGLYNLTAIRQSFLTRQNQSQESLDVISLKIKEISFPICQPPLFRPVTFERSTFRLRQRLQHLLYRFALAR